MTKILQLELPDEAYDALVQLAQGSGQLPEQMVAEWILSAGHMITNVSSSSLHSRTRRSAAAPRTPVAAQNDGATSSSHSKPTLAGASYALKITLLESKPAL